MRFQLRLATWIQAFLVLTASFGWARDRAIQDGAEATRRPNILFAMADDWGWPHAGALGAKYARTPTFDRLAETGVLFRHAYASSPSCTPSRNAILTGQDFYRLGEGGNLHSTLDVRIPTFVRQLREAGYAVGHHRKAWGPGDFRAGGYEENPCGVGGSLDEFLKKREPDQPFCFWLGTSDPHRPYRNGSGREAGVDLDAVQVPPFLPDTEAVRGDIADYLVEVERWDREVGEALAQLEAAGELGNTLVVMTSDHGMPFPRCKGNLYDSGTRVPLVASWGREGAGIVGHGRHDDSLVCLTDLAPTFLEAAGIPVPEAMTGRSLLPLLRDPQAPPLRSAVVTGRERHTPAQAMPSLNGYPSRAIRTGRWLLIHNLEPDRWPAGVPGGATHPMAVFSDCDGGPTKQSLIRGADAYPSLYARCFGRRPAFELYDCVADPDQLHNLAEDPAVAETFGELQRELDRYLRATGDPRTGPGPSFDAFPYRARYLEKHLKKHAR